MNALDEIRTLARDVARELLKPKSAEWDREGKADEDTLAELGRMGFFGMRAPARYGGLGLDLETYLAALEELAQGDIGAALLVAERGGTAPEAILELGRADQVEKWLPGLARGEKKASAALGLGRSERRGSAKASLRAASGGWTLSGRTGLMWGGATADLVLALASEGRVSARALLLDADSPGCAREAPQLSGLASGGVGSICFSEAPVSRAQCIDEGEADFAIVAKARSLGRLAEAAISVGAARAAKGHARAYAEERRQFGRPIARFGAVARILDEMEARVSSTAALISSAARQWDALSEEGRTRRSLTVQRIAADAAVWTADKAVGLFGGYGFMREYPVEKLFRDSVGLDLLCGAGAHAKN